jgi:hypothetical protein
MVRTSASAGEGEGVKVVTGSEAEVRAGRRWMVEGGSRIRSRKCEGCEGCEGWILVLYFLLLIL